MPFDPYDQRPCGRFEGRAGCMHMSGLNLRDFEYVIAVADLGSFVRAAQQCRITQPSLSTQVAKLEDRLGTVIFERGGRRNVVTRQGRRLIEQMRKVIGEVGSLVALSAPPASTFGGALRISAITTLGPYYFPHVAGGLRQRYPELTFVLGEGRVDELITGLVDESVDAILVGTPVPDTDLHVEPLFWEPFLMASQPDRAKGQDAGKTWRDLDPGRRLLLNEGHCLREQALAACADVLASSRSADSLEILKYRVAAGEGCALVPALAANATAGVAYSPVHGAECGRRVALAWRRADPRAGQLRAIAAHLKSSLPPAAAALAASP